MTLNVLTVAALLLAGIGVLFWLACKLGDALAWWASVTREDGDLE